MKTIGGTAGRQGSASDNAHGDIETEAATGALALRRHVNDQLEFGIALVSQGLITETQLDLAIRHATASGATIAHSLIYLGAITQKSLLRSMETLEPGGA